MAFDIVSFGRDFLSLHSPRGGVSCRRALVLLRAARARWPDGILYREATPASSLFGASDQLCWMVPGDDNHPFPFYGVTVAVRASRH